VKRNILYLKASDRRSSLLKYEGACRAAKTFGWRLQTVDAAEGGYSEPARLLAFWRPDGVLVDCGDLKRPPAPAAFGTVPTVFLGRRPHGDEAVFSVCEDLRATAYAAARELLQLGLTHYAFVGYPEPRLWSREREMGFREAVTLNGKSYRAFTKAARQTDLLGWTRQLRAWLTDLPRPCGIFAANDVVASRILNACSQEHLRVPDDFALIGVDNDESICLNTTPTLSSVLSDFERGGYLAARILAARLHSPHMKPAFRTFPPLMTVRRESTRAKRPPDDFVAEACTLIRARACAGLRARDVAAHFRGSRRLAEMRFREATGHSILEEIHAVRLERARELLSDSRRQVKAVANFCGYASEAAFRKLYRKAFGHPPRQA